jgi:hypothetical protein
MRNSQKIWILVIVFFVVVSIVLGVMYMNRDKDNFKQKPNPLPLKNMLDLVKQKQKVLPPRPIPYERFVPPPPETFVNKTPIAETETPVELPKIPSVENFEAVDIPACPCGLQDSCQPGCNCGKCSNVEKFHQKQDVWVQNIIPISSSIKSSTRSGADVIRGDVPISSSGASQGWFKTSESNRTLEKGARQLVFGM